MDLAVFTSWLEVPGLCFTSRPVTYRFHCVHDNGGTGGTREVPDMLRTNLTDILPGGELKRPLRSTRGASSLVMQRDLPT